MKKYLCHYKIFIFVIFLLGNSVRTYAQTRDELKAKLKTEQRFDDRLNTYTDLFREYLDSDLDSATVWIDKAMVFVGDKKWPKHYRRALLRVAQGYQSQGEYRKAAEYAKYMSDHYKLHGNNVDQFKALKIQATTLSMHGEIDASLSMYKKIKLFLDNTTIPDKIEHNDCYGLYYYGVGFTHHHAGKASIALKYLLQSDSVFQTGGKDSYVLQTKSTLGTVYGMLGDPKSGIAMLKEVVQIYNDGNKSIRIQSTYNNIASFYLDLEDYKNARKYINLSIDHGYESGDLSQIGFDHYFMGAIEQGEKKYKAASKEYLKALDYFERSNLIHLIYHARFSYIECAVELKEIEPRLLTQIDEIIPFFKESGETEGWGEAHKLRADILRSMNRFDEAYRELELSDSIIQVHLKAIHSKEGAELKTKYETDLHKRESAKQAKIAKQQSNIALQNKRENKWKTTLLLVIGGASIILFIILGLLYVLYRQLKQSQVLLNAQKISIEKSEKEKSTLLKELHHRVKNNLQIVSSLLNLQKENVKDEAAKGAFTEGQNRIEAMAMIHRYLYSTDELTDIELGEYFTQLVQSIAYSYGYAKDKVAIEFDITEANIDVDIAIPLGLVANELVSNVFKHAIKETENPTLYVGLHSGKELILQINDNGAGIPGGLKENKSSSFGLSLINSLAKQMKATLEYTYDNGSKIRMTIPKSSLLNQNESNENCIA
ncbi:MAG: two-component sensor histidine kinase/tetratricopeptide (TPR) repeat protein [Crocinitomicaceae bacterium]|jgi:two-component sensor histidine kinase/tetratricopeptide (TPR) repeat protein